MGCGCLSPLFGGKRTQRRVQSHSDHTGETPTAAVRPLAVQEEAIGVKSEPPPVSATRDKPMLIPEGHERGAKSGGVSGASVSALVEATAEGVNALLARGPDGLDGAIPVEERAVTPNKKGANAGGVTGASCEEGPPKSSTSGQLVEAATTPALGVTDGIVLRESAEVVKKSSVRKQSVEAIPAATGGELMSTAKTDGESGLARLSAVPQSLDREGSIVAGWLEQGLIGRGTTQPTHSPFKLAGIDEGLEDSDLTFPKLVMEPRPVEQLNPSSQEQDTPTNKRASHNPVVSSEDNPSKNDTTDVLTQPNSPLSAFNGGTILTTSKFQAENVVPLKDTPVEAKGPEDKGGASPQGDSSGAPRSAEKNRASHLQQAFLVADLGFQMEPVRKERPNLERVPADSAAADSAGAQKRTALEQLSLLQLDIDDDLLSDLSPRAESVPSPESAGTASGTGFGSRNENGIGKGKVETPSHWDASESDMPGRESSFLTDASENGMINRNGTTRESGAPRTLSPSPVSDGPVSPVQAALRLIKRTQRLASPSKKRRSVESPEAGSGTEKSAPGVGNRGAEPESSPAEHRLVFEAKPVKAKGLVEAFGQKLPGTQDGESETFELSKDANEQKVRAGSKKRAGRPVGVYRAEESAQDEGSSQASSPVRHLPSEASEATTVGSSSPVGSTSESLRSDATATRVARSRDGRQLEKARGSESGRHNTKLETQGGSNGTKKGLRVSEISLSSSEAERRQSSKDGSQRRAVGTVTSPPPWREKREPQKAAPGGTGTAGESEAATWHDVAEGATARAESVRDAPEALRNGNPPSKSSAHKATDAETRPGGETVSPVGTTGHWQVVKASLQHPTLSWREKLSQLEESVHLFSDASKNISRGEKSRGSAIAKDPPETKAKPTEEGMRLDKAREKTDVAPTVETKAVRGRDSGRGMSTGQVAPGQKGLGRSITTPSKRGAWKAEAGRFGTKPGEATKGKGVVKEEGAKGKEATEARPQLLRSKSLPRERPERSDRSAAATKPTDLESKQLWLAAEEKRIKDEAVRLAGLAASLERETERLERQRAQAEKLERDMRERFGALDNRHDRPSPQSEGLPSTDRWAVGAVKRQASKRGGDKGEQATIPPSETLLLSPPRSRSQPGSRASSRPRSRKGEERARRSQKDEDSSSSGTTSNRSARSVRRKKFERSKSAGRLRTSELGRGAPGRSAADGFGISGDQFLTKRGGRSEVQRQGRASKWDDIFDKGSKQERSATAKLADQPQSAKSAQVVPPGSGRQDSDSLEALYRAVSTGTRLDEVIKRQANPGSRRMTRDDVEAPGGATSPASSLSSQNGSGSARERKRNQRTEQKRSVKGSAHRETLTPVEILKKPPARARASDWMETDAETDMEEVRRKMRRKEVQELAELEEFEEIEKTVMDC